MTASNFPTCLAFTLQYEGGRSNNPKDPGGKTNEGVTQRTYDAFRTSKGQSRVDVYSMPAAERDDIYHSEYWDKVIGDHMESGVDLACFDLAVNSGATRAKDYYQAAGGAAIAIKDAVKAVQAICAKRLSFLHALRTFKTFGKGWTTRVAACEALGVRLALQGRYGATATPIAASGIGKQLQVHADAAKTKANRHKAALAAPIATAPVVSTQVNAAPIVVGIVIIFALAIAAYFAWRAHINSARASAYADAAKGVLT